MLPGPLDKQAFESLVREEAERVERGSCPAALVSARLTGGRAEPCLLAILAGLRSTDRGGVLEPGEIGLLLPATTRAGARRALARVAARVPELAVEGARIETLRPALHSARRRARERSRAARRDSARVCLVPAGLLALTAEPISPRRRALDVVLALTGLVLLAPLFAAVALAVRCTSPGPAIYRQSRTGARGRRFEILKFRSMRVGSHVELARLQHLNEMSGPLFKAQHDPRLTPIGAFLRRTSLDELPQLVNVLRGEMTLIGPRALSPLPSQYEAWQLQRFWLAPGIACRWQAQRRADTDFTEWMRSDVAYAKQPRSGAGDLRLLVETLASVVRGRGGR